MYILDSTPVLPSRSGTSRHSDHVAADLGQVQVELHEQATTNNQETTAEAAASSDPQTSNSKSPDHSTDLHSDTDKQDAISSRQNSSSLPQCNHHDEEPESETVSKFQDLITFVSGSSWIDEMIYFINLHCSY